MPYVQDFWGKSYLASFLLHAGKIKTVIRESPRILFLFRFYFI